jgi:prefoldin subunit 5
MNIIDRHIKELQMDISQFQHILEGLSQAMSELEKINPSLKDKNGFTNESRLTWLEVKFIETRATINRCKNTINELEDIKKEIKQEQIFPDLFGTLSTE